MQTEGATSSLSEQNLTTFSIEISDTEDEIAPHDSDDRRTTVTDGFTNIDPIATFSDAESLPKQQHVKMMRVLMIVKIVK